jgi:hypothetical protein
MFYAVASGLQGGPHLQAGITENQSGSWHRKRLRPGRKPDPGPRTSGSRLALYHVHVNTAGLHASTAMGLSGRLEFDSSNCRSNHGLC